MRQTPEFGETISNEFVKGLGLIDEKTEILQSISESNAEGIALEAGIA